MKFKKGARVQWKWLGGIVEGTVVESYLTPVVREIKGKKIKRNGSPEKPAYLVKSVAGNEALKLQTELMKRERKSISRSKKTAF
jgi:hypothetical protein